MTATDWSVRIATLRNVSIWKKNISYRTANRFYEIYLYRYWLSSITPSGTEFFAYIKNRLNSWTCIRDSRLRPPQLCSGFEQMTLNRFCSSKSGAPAQQCQNCDIEFFANILAHSIFPLIWGVSHFCMRGMLKEEKKNRQNLCTCGLMLWRCSDFHRLQI